MVLIYFELSVSWEEMKWGHTEGAALHLHSHCPFQSPLAYPFQGNKTSVGLQHGNNLENKIK